MRNLAIVLLFIAEVSFAQLQLPEISPEALVKQKVGFTTFNIYYSRPAARQRKIMNGVVPYKKLWRTGAGPCTTISFDQDVVISNKTIPAGIYALVTIPDEKEWTVLLNSDTSKVYGDPSEYSTTTEVLQFQVIPERSDRFYESLTIDLDIVRYDAEFFLSWENTRIHFPIATGSHQKALANISKALKESPENQELLSQASWYYYMNNESPEQILQWLNKALSMGEDRWILRQKVDVLERMKNYKEARVAANTAIAFLKKTKPSEWEISVDHYETKMKGWPEK
jgi:tetratricopeptide (TPR) repeat protein